MSTTVLAPSLTEVKTLIDARLSDYCKVRTLSAAQVGERYQLLWNSISTLLEKGGKRLRPFMLITAFDTHAPDGDIEAILPAALAQEMIHVAMLIHDDIIDRDDTRYGIKNIIGQYEDLYVPYIQDPQERTHMTHATALLAGDVLLSDSYRLLSRVNCAPEVITQAMAILSNGVFEVVGGELLDTESSFIASSDIHAENIARYKTASYSFISPLTMGATLAGAAPEEIRLLHQFAEVLGVGYQLRDDLLGTFGEESQTGKSTSTDITEGKRTFLIEQFELCATATQKKQFAEIFHNPDASDEAISAAKNILRESGAKARVEERITDLQQTAEKIIALLSISDEAKKPFQQLMAICLDRES